MNEKQILKEYAELHKEEIKELKKKWSKERRKLYFILYYQENKQKLKKYSKNWVENNQEHVKKYRKEYYKNMTREEKDNQIDLMAEMIDELSEYYTRYWGKNNEFCKEDCIKKDIDCKDCVKQYFERKSKE